MIIKWAAGATTSAAEVSETVIMVAGWGFRAPADTGGSHHALRPGSAPGAA